jgi:hypothetical protein
MLIAVLLCPNQNIMEAGEKITNLDFLSNFAAGDTTRMKKYIGMFLQIAPQQMEKIKSSPGCIRLGCLCAPMRIP